MGAVTPDAVIVSVEDAADKGRRSLTISTKGAMSSAATLSLTQARKLQHRLGAAIAELDGGKKPPRIANKWAAAAALLGFASLVTVGLASVFGALASHIALRRSAALDGAGRRTAIAAMCVNYCFAALLVIFVAAFVAESLLLSSS